MSQKITEKIDSQEKIIRFGCGSLFAIIPSLYFLIEYVPENWIGILLPMAIASLFFGYVSVGYGDRFWCKLFDFVKRALWFF